jgi:hypothetical protein
VTQGPIKPNKSVTRGVGPRDSRPFSSFDDLASWAVRLGRASDVDDVRNNHRELWGDLLFTWYTQGQVACVFAQRLARNAADAKWFSAVIDGEWTGDDVTGLVDASAAFGAEGLQVLFPCDGTVEDALAITRALGRHPRWQCIENEWLEGESGDSVQVGIRWISPEREYESWVLGIAPFEPMPFTRRLVGAPFVGLVLRPTPPVPTRASVPTGTTGLPASHLAHMDDGLGSDDEKREKWMEGTRRAKRALISPDPMSRARAKVTFAFPAWARSELRDIFESGPSKNR